MFDVISRVVEAKTRKIRISPVNSNRASQIGHPCERRLVYMRTRWQEQILPDPDLMFIFEAGSTIEEEAVKELKEAGFIIQEQQIAVSLPEYQITGHLDFKISENGKDFYPCEVKSMSPFYCDKIQSLDDMLNSDKPWLKSYPAQLLLYMWMSDEDEGLFYIKNKATHKPHTIWVCFNGDTLDYVEMILDKAKRINEYVAKGKLPNRIEYQSSICDRCEYRHICLPDMNFDGAEVLNSPDIEALIERYLELKSFVKEHKELNETLKTIFKGKRRTIVGQYVVEIRESNRKGYTVPDGTVTRMKIINLGG